MEYTSKEVYEYISKQLNDRIVEWKKCRLSWQEFPIYQSDLEFYDKVSPTFEVSQSFAENFLKKNSDVKNNFEYKNWKLKVKLPTPTLCLEERERQRFAFRNDIFLYRWKCGFSWKSIICTISPDKDYIVYDYPIWRSDNWTASEMERENWVTNFALMNKLVHAVPIFNRFALNNENSEFVNYIQNTKNSYMCFSSETLENSLYVQWDNFSKECTDCLFCDYSENCFDCVQINHCFWLQHSDYCTNCSNSSYLYNCTWCHDCFNCSNLDNQSYCINNKQYTQEEYNRLFPMLKHQIFDKYVVWCNKHNTNDCFWNNITDSNNCVFTSTVTECENIKYTSYDIIADNCMDSLCASHYCIYTSSGRYSYYSWILVLCRDLKNCRYCIHCFQCSNCFGCVWLKNREYCIYNKQYTKEEYNQIVPQIIAQMIRDKEWWEFFDPQISYYWYNETIAMDYYPLKKEEAIKLWYKWNDYESPMPNVEKIVQWKDLPKQWCKIIKEKKPEILEKILNYAIICEVSNKPFRVTKQEIEFYIRHNIPLPTKHPNIRHRERFARKDPTIMKLINCDICWEKMLSVHKPLEWKKILCEKCFYKNK